MSRGDATRFERALGLLLVVGALALAARGLERRNTWYLASDQFAFLTSADDLRHGRIFHDPDEFRRVFPLLSGAAGKRLVLFQTYHLDGDRLYSQYPPGFPMLLALAGALGGSTVVHLVNPISFLLLMGLLGALGWVLAPREQRWAVAACTVWLVLVLPTQAHYWGITVTRDAPAHLLGLAAILAARAGRHRTAALALGAAFTMRPDVLLYGVPIGIFVLLQRPPGRLLVHATCCFLVAASPAFAYNTVTGGHPLAFPQAGEFQNLMARIEPPTALAAEPARPHVPSHLPGVGGFQISNLPKTLPRNVRYLGRALDDLWPLTLGVLAVALLRLPSLAAAVAVYPLLALVFYSCWGHSDPRYLFGATLSLLVASGLGLVALFESLAPRRELRTRVLGLAALSVLLGSSVTMVDGTTGGPVLFGSGLVLGCALLSPLRGRLHVTGWLAFMPALVLAAVTAAGAPATVARDPFQREQIEHARQTLESIVPPGALVVTSDRLGRPAENIAYYTHADAIYLGALQRLRMPLQRLLARSLATGRRVFLLLDASQGIPVPHAARSRFRFHAIARRADGALYDWFVDPRRVPQGAVLYEVDSLRAPRVRHLST